MSIKKIFNYFVVVVITMFCCNEYVFAADSEFPNYSSETINAIADYYCSYNMGQVFDANSGSFEAGHYNNKEIYLTYYNGEIYYIHPGNKDIKAGKYRTGQSYWDKTGYDQTINFDSTKLKEYLVDSTGKFTCKELNFFEQNGDLEIVIPFDYNLTNLVEKTPAYSGTLMYKGVNLDNKCSELENQISQIKQNYQSDAKINALDGLKNLSSQNIYQIGDKDKADTDFQTFMSVYDNSFKEFQNLKVGTASNSETFNISQCDAINSKISMNYEALKESFENDLAAAKSYNDKLIELNGRTEQNIRNSGNTELADAIAAERGTLVIQQDEIMQAQREYRNFIENANLGYLGDRVDTNCEGILGEDLLDYIDKLFNWIKIAVPIIVIVLGSIDFAQGVLLDDKDALRKATSRFVKRCIIAVAIFFIPTILSYLLHIFNGLTTSGGISTCGIG